MDPHPAKLVKLAAAAHVAMHEAANEASREIQAEREAEEAKQAAAAPVGPGGAGPHPGG